MFRISKVTNGVFSRVRDESLREEEENRAKFAAGNMRMKRCRYEG